MQLPVNKTATLTPVNRNMTTINSQHAISDVLHPSAILHWKVTLNSTTNDLFVELCSNETHDLENVPPSLQLSVYNDLLSVTIYNQQC